MQHAAAETVKRFLLVWFPFFMIIGSTYGQNEGQNQPEAPPPGEPAHAATPEAINPVQNAVIEGIQLSSEPGKEQGENIVTCYFIFRDKPSSYFYEVKRGTRKLMFEFNDTQKGSSPIPSTSQAPIDGFEIEQRKIDINKEVKGMNPEWHDLVSVSFSLSAIPQISVTDEYNVISFTYKWSSDPAKATKYMAKEGKTNWTLATTLGGIGLLLAGGAGYYYWKHRTIEQPPAGPLDTTDLPSHTQTQPFLIQ
jgi:hypothetical protein